ncbi:hypothetical protein BGZ79_000905 [Entomortierella chlamydospora]|nr:hypothetical protein BGZ79_000905 [Entomortierella chlamydospora]
MPGPRLAPEGNTSLFGATYLAFFSETQLRYGSLCQGNKKKKELLQEAAFAFKEYNIRGRKVDLLFQTVYKNHKDKEVRTNLAVFEAKCATASKDIPPGFNPVRTCV